MGSAMTIIKANQWKYDENFYGSLPLEINIYIAEDGELFIDPNRGEAPEEFITKRKPNPEYYNDERYSSITEETLTE